MKWGDFQPHTKYVSPQEQSARYWPMDKLRQHGDLFVELTQQQDFVTYTTREFSITNTKVCTSSIMYYGPL